MAVGQGQRAAYIGAIARRFPILGRAIRLVMATMRIIALVPRTLVLPANDRRTTARALPILFIVEALIRWVPVPRLARLLGLSMPSTGHAPDEATPPTGDLDGSGLLRSSSRDHTVSCVQRLAREWPLGAGPCLRESLVLGHLLRHERPALRLGVARGPRGRIRAHAWIEIDGEAVNDPLGYQPFAGTTTATAT